MKTKYLTTVTSSLNPFARHAKTPRLFLSLLPPNARSSVKITVTQLKSTSTDPSTLELGFKDGKKMTYSFRDPMAGEILEQVKIKDIVEEVERHSRGLSRKEELSG